MPSFGETWQRMVRWCTLAAVAVSLGVAGGCNKDVSDKDLRSIDTAAVKRLMDTSKPGALRLVDARTPEQFAQGHISNAINLTVTDVPERERLPKEVESAKTVVVYGQNPGSAFARGVAKRFVLSGHKGVRVYEGGVDAWTQAGHTLTQPTPR